MKKAKPRGTPTSCPAAPRSWRWPPAPPPTPSRHRPGLYGRNCDFKRFLPQNAKVLPHFILPYNPGQCSEMMVSSSTRQNLSVCTQLSHSPTIRSSRRKIFRRSRPSRDVGFGLFPLPTAAAGNTSPASCCTRCAWVCACAWGKLAIVELFELLFAFLFPEAAEEFAMSWFVEPIRARNFLIRTFASKHQRSED